MRINQWCIALLFPVTSLAGRERGSNHARTTQFPRSESYTRGRRGQELFGKGVEKITLAPTFAPTRKPTYLPTALSSVDTADRVPGPTDDANDAVPIIGTETTVPATKSPKGPSAEASETPSSIDAASTVPPAVTGEPVVTMSPSPLTVNGNPSAGREEPSAPQGSSSGDCDGTILASLFEGFGQSEDLLAVESYQCLAWQRVTQQEGFNNFDVITTMKYWILNCIYFATNQPLEGTVLESRQSAGTTTWINRKGWQSTNQDPCDGWFGISCDGDGRVTEIRLQRNGLSGTFPREVRYLASEGPYSTGAGALKRLELHNNQFLTNDPTHRWISELGPGLQVLNYGSTGFQGQLPTLPSGIVEFDCSYTLHSGEISESIFEGLDNLELLMMDGNNFDSVVPTTVSALPSLKFFYIREALIRGDLSYMHGMPAIVEHQVDGNPQLTGPIYSFIGKLSTLRSFSVADCGLVRKNEF